MNLIVKRYYEIKDINNLELDMGLRFHLTRCVSPS